MDTVRPPRDRRVSVSDLKKTKKALKKALRKETTRRDKLVKLHKENEELSFQLNRMRNERNFPFECC